MKIDTMKSDTGAIHIQVAEYGEGTIVVSFTSPYWDVQDALDKVKQFTLPPHLDRRELVTELLHGLVDMIPQVAASLPARESAHFSMVNAKLKNGIRVHWPNPPVIPGKI